MRGSSLADRAYFGEVRPFPPRVSSVTATGAAAAAVTAVGIRTKDVREMEKGLAPNATWMNRLALRSPDNVIGAGSE